MQRYNPSEIEPKWQKTWDEKNSYHVEEDSSKQKLYVSGMFPYPSASGLHSGHAFSYTIVDAIARFHRTLGKNVLNPMGWDTFGLPAENFAIKTGTAPAVVTKDNIANFKTQFKRLGISIDWDREINTTDPEYYRWTQWIFAEFYKRGLAYQKEAAQWWCPVDKTVLANEQVENGKCWRCGNEVEKKSMTQWFFKITDKADALLEEIPNLDWPEKIKVAQTNWIGRSEGVVYKNKVRDTDIEIESFSAHFEAFTANTFVAIAPDHPMLPKLLEGVENGKEILKDAKKMAIERDAGGPGSLAEVKGIFTGRYAIDVFGDEDLPIWIANYALADYGTGIVLCSAHDERDFEFAKKYDIRLKPTMVPIDPAEAEKVKKLEYCFTDMADGVLIEPKAFEGKIAGSHRQEIMDYMVHEGYAYSQVTYKMRDWLISRQRYWGAPIPIIHCEKDGAVAVPDDQLPVLLPEVNDYEPKGESVLAAQTDWVNTTCPTCGGPAKRETDTMDGYACSSWYLLRYADPNNDKQAWSPEKANYWSPVDYYVGGDHAVAHLLYVRFWAHVFNDMKLLDHKEPVKKLVYHGYINAEDGRKMSKSLGNVIDPLDIVDQGYGADTLRTYVLFMGPIEQDSAWSSKGVGGVYRFLNRVWTLAEEFKAADKSDSLDYDKNLQRLTHKTIKKVTSDYNTLGFNTAIAAMMEYVNELYKLKVGGFSNEFGRSIRALAQLLGPVAPHIAAELWEQFEGKGALDSADWPNWDEALVAENNVTIVVQVNGKVRANLVMPSDVDEKTVTDAALLEPNVLKFTEGAQPVKVIFVAGKLLNIVIKGK